MDKQKIHTIEFICQNNPWDSEDIDSVIKKLENIPNNIEVYLRYIFNGKTVNGIQFTPANTKETVSACDWLRAHINRERYPVFSRIKGILICNEPNVDVSRLDLSQIAITANTLKNAIYRNGFKVGIVLASWQEIGDNEIFNCYNEKLIKDFDFTYLHGLILFKN